MGLGGIMHIYDLYTVCNFGTDCFIELAPKVITMQASIWPPDMLPSICIEHTCIESSEQFLTTLEAVPCLICITTGSLYKPPLKCNYITIETTITAFEPKTQITPYDPWDY